MVLINAIQILINPVSERDEVEEANKFIIQLKEQNIFQFISSLIQILKTETHNKSIGIEALILLRNTIKVNSLKNREEIRQFWLSEQFQELQLQLKSLLIPLLFSDDIYMEGRNSAATISSIIYIEDYSPDIFDIMIQNAQKENKAISFVMLMTELLQTGLYSIIDTSRDNSIPQTYDLLLLCLNNIQNPESFPDIRFSNADTSIINSFIQILLNCINALLDNVPRFFDSPSRIETLVESLFPSFSIADEFTFQQLYNLLHRFLNDFYEMSTDFCPKIFEAAENGLSCNSIQFLTIVFEFYTNLIETEYSFYYSKFPSFFLDLIPNFKPKNINLSSTYSHNDPSFVPKNLVSLVFGFSVDSFNEDITFESIPLLNQLILLLFQRICSADEKENEIDTNFCDSLMTLFSSLIRYFPPISYVFFQIITQNISNMDYKSRYIAINLIKSISDAIRCDEFEVFVQQLVSNSVFEELLHADEPPIVGITLEVISSLLSKDYSIEFEKGVTKEFTISLLKILLELILQQNVFENTIFVKLELINIQKILSYFLPSSKSMEFYPNILEIISSLRENIITTEQEEHKEDIEITDIIYACDNILIAFANNCKGEEVISLHLQSYSSTNAFIERLCGDDIFDRVNRISSSLFVLYNLIISIMEYDIDSFNDNFPQYISLLFNFLDKRDITLCEHIFLIFIKIIQQFGKHDLISSKIQDLLNFSVEAIEVGNFRLTSKALDLIGYILCYYFLQINIDEFNQIIQNVFQMLTSTDNLMLSICQPNLLKCINMAMQGSKSHFDASLYDQYANILGEMMRYDVNLNDEDELLLWYKTYKEIFRSFPIMIKLNPDIIDTRGSPLYVTNIILFIRKKIVQSNIYDIDLFHSFVDFIDDISLRKQRNILRILKSKETIALVSRIHQSAFSDQALHNKAQSLLNKLSKI